MMGSRGCLGCPVHLSAPIPLIRLCIPLRARFAAPLSISSWKGEREGVLRERDGDDAVSFLPIQSSRKRFTEPTHNACNDKRATRTL